MLYTFKIERSGELFTLCKHHETWTHLNGNLPNKDCVQQLGGFMDHLDGE